VSGTASPFAAQPYSYAEVDALSRELGLSEPVAVTLVRRGYRTPEAARAFLAADEMHSPSAFDSMEAVVERVGVAIAEGQQVTVHGDFDVDGVCATTLMVSTLRKMGAECDWFIPSRVEDGYGVSTENVRRLAERGTELLLTVDCGITSVEEVALARELGMEVVVTDHHQPAEELPDCLILHPQVSSYPFEGLCGTAVAWKLACALRANPAMGDLDLVALATVADVVPLVGENRALVRKGLAEIRRGERPGIKALLEVSKCDPERMDESDLGFRLAPRINAAGRLYRADAGVELFLTEDSERAMAIAEELSRANSERRATEREVDTAAEAARRKLPEDLQEARGFVVAGRGWHPGVVGIVASRLVERHHRPAVVIGLKGEVGKGSGRSIAGFDLGAAVIAARQAGLLLEGGGHPMAAGLTVRADRLDALADFLSARLAHACGPGLPPPPDLALDGALQVTALSTGLAERLGALAPYGRGNPEPRFMLPEARSFQVRRIGDGHLDCWLQDAAGGRVRAVAFRAAEDPLGAALLAGGGAPLHLAGTLKLDRWQGAPRVSFRIEDAARCA
jgi:single-stranded-DNA-specific exonuclease